MQKSNRYEHPHKVIITDAIKYIKKFKKEGHEIILSIYGNEAFTNAKGEIAKMCKDSRTDILINKTRNRIYEDKIKLIFYFTHTIY